MASLMRPSIENRSYGRFVREFVRSTGQTLRVLAPMYIDERAKAVITAAEVTSGATTFGGDFSGAVGINTSAAGAPTLGITANPDALGGRGLSALTDNTSEAQATGIIWASAVSGTNADIDVRKPGGCEFEIQFDATLSTVPAHATHEVFVGLTSAYQTVTTSFPEDISGFKGVGFRLQTAGAIRCVTDDNTTATEAAATPTYATATRYHLRIEWDNETTIRFYVNGAQVCMSTAFTLAAISTTKLARAFYVARKANTTPHGCTLSRVQLWTGVATT